MKSYLKTMINKFSKNIPNDEYVLNAENNKHYVNELHIPVLTKDSVQIKIEDKELENVMKENYVFIDRLLFNKKTFDTFFPIFITGKIIVPFMFTANQTFYKCFDKFEIFKQCKTLEEKVLILLSLLK